MKIIKYAFVILLIFLFSRCSEAEKNHYVESNQRVFVVAGQSNASGVGDAEVSPFIPNKQVFEYNSLIDSLQVLKDPVGQNHLNFQAAQTGSFIPALAYTYTDITNNEVIVIQTAKGGSALTPKSEQNNYGNWSDEGELFNSSIEKTEKALKFSKSNTIDAIFWCQGENDGAGIYSNKISKNEYSIALKHLINRYHSQFGDIPFIIIETGDFEGDEPKSNCYQKIREAQREVAEEMEKVYIGYNETEFFIERGWLKDVVHYNQQALNDIGEKLAYFYYSLEN